MYIYLPDTIVEILGQSKEKKNATFYDLNQLNIVCDIDIQMKNEEWNQTQRKKPITYLYTT